MSGCSSGVEHHLAKVRVVRSNRITRSISSDFFITLICNQNIGINRLCGYVIGVGFAHVSESGCPRLTSN